MKRIVVCLLAAVLVMTAAPAAAAAGGTTYELLELNMSIEMPVGWLVWMQDTAPDDKLLEGAGYDFSDMQEQMKSRDIYLTAVESLSAGRRSRSPLKIPRTIAT